MVDVSSAPSAALLRPGGLRSEQRQCRNLNWCALHFTPRLTATDTEELGEAVGCQG